MRDTVFIVNLFGLTDVYRTKEEALEAYKAFPVKGFIETAGEYVPATDPRVHHVVKWSKAAEELLKNIEP
jgi:hypothetical protein